MTCQHPAGNAGAVCRAAAGDCDVAQTCTGTSTACPADAVKPSTTVCRASAGECDPAENCTGSSATCPADAKAPAGTACTDDGNPCTRDECDGTHDACQHPAGNAGAVCRASAGACDPQENCTGTGPNCPADARSLVGTACTSDGNPCTLDQCDGTSVTCQHPAGNAGATCRPSAGVCDVAETCDGTSTACPADGFQSSSTVCRAAAGPCDVAENCTGAGPNCPADAFKPSSTVCRPSAGPCDVAESCTGSSAACRAEDMIKANGTACTDDGNPCTNDICNGVDTACHHPNWPAGTSCENSDGVVCTADLCDGGGKCISTPQDARCDDANDCSIDSCNPGLAPPDGTGCVHVVRTSVSTGCTPSDPSHPNSCGCNDGNPCTTFDRCQQDLSGNIFCKGDNLPDNTQCSAATACASAAVCMSGICTPTSMAPDGTPCDDHNVCTGTAQVPDACQSGKCVPGPLNSAAPCDDGNECTTGDHCAMVAVNVTQFAPGCIGVPAAGNCDDGDACTGDRLFGSMSDTCQSGACQPGSSETVFCKQWGKMQFSTNSGHCRSTDGACCTICSNTSSGVTCNCCLPKGLNCIGGGTPCCSGTVRNVVMAGTCSTPTGPAGTGVVGVCK